MTSKKAAAKRAPKKAAAPSTVSPLATSLRDLLHTIRCIAQHEDALCILLHNLRNAPANPELHHELRLLLDELPSRDFADDLDALHRALLPL